MKRILFAILFATTWFSAFSQVDGDVEIISVPDDGKNFTYPEDDLRTENNSPAVRTKRKNPLLNPVLTKGWRLFAEFAMQKATDKYTCDVIDFSMSLGWQLNPYIYCGFGIGEQGYADHWYFGSYSDKPTFALVLPAFLDFRYDFLRKKITPFADFRIGYAASDDQYNNYSGLYLSPSAGGRIYKFNIAFGVEITKLDRPWLFMEKVNGKIQTTEVKFQASYMIKLSYEWGGNF